MNEGYSQLVKFFLFPQVCPLESNHSAVMISRMTHDDLEHYHDWVQWAFPMMEPSQCQPHTPVLTQDDLSLLRGLYGLQYEGTLNLYWYKVYEFFDRDDWIYRPHNFLRITRIIRSLTLFEEDEKRNRFYTMVLCRLTNKLTEGEISAEIFRETMDYWRDALI